MPSETATTDETVLESPPSAIPGLILLHTSFLLCMVFNSCCTASSLHKAIKKLGFLKPPGARHFVQSRTVITSNNPKGTWSKYLISFSVYPALNGGECECVNPLLTLCIPRGVVFICYKNEYSLQECLPSLFFTTKPFKTIYIYKVH